MIGTPTDRVPYRRIGAKDGCIAKAGGRAPIAQI
jgi:hypothetical protein